MTTIQSWWDGPCLVHFRHASSCSKQLFVILLWTFLMHEFQKCMFWCGVSKSSWTCESDPTTCLPHRLLTEHHFLIEFINPWKEHHNANTYTCTHMHSGHIGLNGHQKQFVYTNLLKKFIHCITHSETGNLTYAHTNTHSQPHITLLILTMLYDQNRKFVQNF